MKLTFILIKYPSGAWGIQTQEPLTEDEAKHLAHKLNSIMEVIQ